MNVDLGNVIWLNISRKFLSYHKWFFSRFEDMPPEVFEEFKKHKHTHPSITVEVFEKGHLGKGESSKAKHHSHDHEDVAGSMDAKTHSATGSTSYVDCGSGYSHRHSVTFGAGGSHSHTITLSFASADLGVPNWEEHVHAISINTISSEGASHTHSVPDNTSYGGCALPPFGICEMNPHRHAKSTMGCANATFAHTHTMGAKNTGNADTGTAASHTHPYTQFNLNSAGGHTHAGTGTVVANATCWEDNVHGHYVPAIITCATHYHTVSAGDSGTGGEEAPPPAVQAGLHPSKVMTILLGD